MWFLQIYTMCMENQELVTTGPVPWQLWLHPPGGLEVFWLYPPTDRGAGGMVSMGIHGVSGFGEVPVWYGVATSLDYLSKGTSKVESVWRFPPHSSECNENGALCSPFDWVAVTWSHQTHPFSPRKRWLQDFGIYLSNLAEKLFTTYSTELETGLHDVSAMARRLEAFSSWFYVTIWHGSACSFVGSKG